jgi:hypothetical protein
MHATGVARTVWSVLSTRAGRAGGAGTVIALAALPGSGKDGIGARLSVPNMIVTPSQVAQFRLLTCREL